MLTKALGDRQVVMAPAVLTELLGDPALPSSAAHSLSDLPLIDIRPGYWHARAASKALLAKKRKARLGDALIAQRCIDGGVPLIARDRDFQTFAETAGLNLIL